MIFRLNAGQGGALVFGPFHEGATDVFRAIVDSNGSWRTTPFDDLVQCPHDALSGQRKVDFDAQTFAVEVVQDVQQPELPTILQPVRHEIHRPNLVRHFWHGQFLGLFPLQKLARLDPEVQFQLTVDPVDTLVVPNVPLDVAQLQKAQAEAPGLLRLRHPGQQVGELLFLIVRRGFRYPEHRLQAA